MSPPFRRPSSYAMPRRWPWTRANRIGSRASALILLAFAGVLLASGAARAQGTVRYVNAGDATCEGHSPCFTTIQSALAGISAGPATVRVQSGEYRESVELVGLNAGTGATESSRIVLERDPTSALGSVVLTSPGKTCDAPAAVHLDHSRFVTVRGFTISAGGADAIVLEGGAAGKNDQVRIERNRIFSAGNSACKSGVWIGRLNTQTLIANNLIYGNSETGVTFKGNASGPTYLVGNTIFGNQHDGVRIPDGHQVTLVDNVIHGNGVHAGTTGGRYGVEYLGDNPSEIRLLSNTICGNRLGEVTGALLDTLDTGNYTPTGGEGPGVTAAAACAARANVFANAYGTDFLLNSPDDDFTPVVGSISVESGVDPRAVGLPSALNADLVVDYRGVARPSDSDGNGAVGFNRGALQGSAAAEDPTIVPNELHVNHTDPSCGGKSPCYSTIQAAVNAVTQKDTIVIQPGTYVEQLEIAELNSAANATPDDRITITADPLAPPGSVVLDGAVNVCTGGWAVRFTHSAYVTLRGLTITGAGAEAIRLRSGLKSNRSILLVRNRIFGNASSGGCDGGIRVGASDDGDETDLNNPDTVIANNLIYNNGRNGISFDRPNGGPHVIVGNTVVANGWNGVFVPKSHTVVIANNILLGNGTQASSSQGRFGVKRQPATPPEVEGITLLHNLVCGNTDGQLSTPALILDASDSGNLTPTGSEGAGVTASPTCASPAALFTALAGSDGTAGTADDNFALAASSPALDRGTDPRLIGLPGSFEPSLIADYLLELARPTDGDGNGSAEFDIGAFERGAGTPPPQNPPTITITAPLEGAHLTSTPVTVTGTVQYSTDVDVNGVAAVVTGTDFRADVPLVEGASTITAHAVNDFGFADATVHVSLDTSCAGPGGPKPNGTPCEDGNLCTTGDHCQAGLCQTGGPVTCTALDACHAPGTCNSATGACSNPPAPNGTLCDDANLCTQIDVCQAGVCAGTQPIVCSALDACHVAGLCAPATGLCSNPTAPDGTSCSDGLSCTTDQCSAGSCLSTSTCAAGQLCDGVQNTCALSCASNAECDDGQFCNGSETCSERGTCVHASNPCASGEVCYEAGDSCRNPGADVDADGLLDGDEIAHGTNPDNPDSDGDALLDGEEVLPGSDGLITDPLNPDTDGDGLNDGLEIALGLDPTNAGQGATQILVTGRDTQVPAGVLNGHDVVITASTLVLTGEQVPGDFELRSGSTVHAQARLAVEGALTVTQSALQADASLEVGESAVADSSSLTVDGGFIVGSELSLLHQSQLTHSAATDTTTPGLDVTAGGEVLIDETSAIDVSEKGYLPGQTLGHEEGSSPLNGASYGGLGGLFDPTGTRNDVYGDFRDPVELGSGDDAGGGRLLLRAPTLTVKGRITADARRPTLNGRGSGGAIRIEAVLRGAGFITSIGGRTNSPAGGGGGGRIAVLGGRDGFTGRISAATMAGGTGIGAVAGGAGTIYLRTASQVFGELVVDNLGTIAPPGSTPLRSIGKGSSTTLQSHRLQDSQAHFPVPNPATGAKGLVGLKLRPKASQAQTFTVVGNTATEIFTDPASGDMTTVASPGDAYTGVYTFDSVTVAGGAQVVSADRCEVTGTFTGTPGTFACAGQDSDGDGLDDADEVLKYHTDATRSDTDGDGFSDGAEIAAGTDPLGATANQAPTAPSLFALVSGDGQFSGQISVCSDDHLPANVCNQTVRAVAAGAPCDAAVVAEATVVNGGWIVTGLQPQTSYTFFGRSSDGALTTCSAGITARTSIPAPALDTLSSPTLQNPISVSGTALPGVTVELRINGETETTAVANATTGRFTFAVVPLLDGPNSITVVALDGSVASTPSTPQVVDYVNNLSRTLNNVTYNTPVVLTAGAGQPYVVTGTFTVGTAGRLILQRGATLRFTSTNTNSVTGILEARGVAGQPVTFTSSTATRGSWNGVQINAGTQSFMRHVLFEYASSGIQVRNGSRLVLQDSTIRQFGTGIAVTAGTADIFNNIFDNSPGTPGGQGITLAASAGTVHVSGNEIVGCGTGISVSAPSAELTDNAIHNNSFGISLGGAASPLMTDNAIQNNAIGMQVGLNNASAHPVAHRNRFEGNPQGQVYVPTSGLDPNQIMLDFEDNWWGSADPVQIAAGIQDHKLFVNAPTIDYVPFQGSPGGPSIGASTVLLGPVSASTVLVPGTVYTLGGALLVPPGVTWTVPPGVQLRAVRDAGIEVRGGLVVNGGAGSPAVFTSALPAPTPGVWPGITLFTGSSGAAISHARIEYATTGVFVKSSVVATVTDSAIGPFNTDGVGFDAGADGAVRNTVIDNSSLTSVRGTGVRLTRTLASVVLQGNTIRGTLTGVNADGTSGTATQNSNVTISQNQLTGNQTGITANKSSPQIVGNGILGSTFRGIQLINGASPVIRENTLEGNATGLVINVATPPSVPILTANRFSNPINVDASASATSPNTQVIAAEGNWWGTLDVSAIATSINDNADLDSRPLVDYVPYLDGPAGQPTGEGSVFLGSLGAAGSSVVLDPAVSYVIGGSVSVPAGATVTIPAGTQLRFVKKGTLRVSGQLLVDGTPDSAVSFVPTTDPPARGDWDGIVINAGASGHLRNAGLEYAKLGIRVLGATFDVEDSTFLHAPIGGGGISYESGASGGIRRNVIDDSTSSVTGINLISPNSALVVEGNHVFGGTTGIHIQDGSPTIRGNELRGASTYGIRILRSGSARIEQGNVISGNGNGIWVDALNFTPQPVVNNNEISFNTSKNMALNSYPSSASALVINAENNFWGVTTTTLIAAKISAGGSQPVIDFDPFVGGTGQVLGGTLTSDTVLSVTTQPYEVVSDLIVPLGRTLTINAGVTLQFGGSASLKVSGKLLIQGTVTAPVEMQKLVANTRWGGVQIEATSVGSSIQYAHLIGATTALTVTGAAVAVANSTIDQSLTGISMKTGAGGTLSGNTISDDPNAILLADSSPTLLGNTIRNATTGLKISGSSAPIVQGGNLFTANTTAIQLLGDFGNSGTPQPVVTGNDFSGNPVNVRLTGFVNGQTPQYDFRGNYFGTSDAAQISASILVENITQTGNQPVPVQFSGYLDRSARDPAAQAAPNSANAFTYLISRVVRNRNTIRPLLGETVTISVDVVDPANVTIQFYPEKSAATGTPLRTLTSTLGSAGTHVLVWDGKDSSGQILVDEAYRYVVAATDARITSTFDPALRGYVAAEFPNGGSAPGAYNPYRNEFLKVPSVAYWLPDSRGRQGTVPARYSLRISPSYLSQGAFTPFTIIDDRPYDGGGVITWDGRDPNGNIITVPIQYYIPVPHGLRPNAVIVQGGAPEITGPGASPNIEVKSNPYLVYSSYNQVAHIAYCLDQDARITVKMLRPGFANPNDPAGVIATLASNELRSATQCGSGGAPHEEVFVGEASPGSRQLQVREDGVHTFTIEATSVADASRRTLYRGVLQVRQ